MSDGSAGAATAVFAGGCAGGLARHLLTTALPAAPASWPWAVVVANTLGAFLLAVLLVWLEDAGPARPWLRPALGTGFCGAFTTMSAVAVATTALGRDGALVTAAWLLVVSAAAGIAAAASGVLLTRTALARRVA